MKHSWQSIRADAPSNVSNQCIMIIYIYLSQGTPACFILPLCTYYSAFRAATVLTSSFGLFTDSRVSFLRRHCHSTKTGRKVQRSSSGHIQSKKVISVFSCTCQSRKSLSRSTPEVRTSRSTGGIPTVSIRESNVAASIFSGSG